MTDKLYTESEVIKFCRAYSSAEKVERGIRKKQENGKISLSENNRIFYGIMLEKYVDDIPDIIRKKLNLKEEELVELLNDRYHKKYL